MTSPPLVGLIAAVHTPFTAAGELRLDAVAAQGEFLLRQGVRTAFVGGSTGESQSLSVAERLQLAERWAQVAAGSDLRVVVHVGANCLGDAQALAAQAQQLGAAAISALAPSYFKPRTLDDLIAWCAAIAGAAPATPFYFYDIPSMTGVHFSMPDFLEQAPARVPTLRGLKFTNTDLMSLQRSLRVAEGAFDVAFGCDEMLLAAVVLGARGAVGSSYNFAAPIYHRLLAAWERGDLAAAREAQFDSVRWIHTLSRYGYMGAAKAVMGLLGVEVGPPRLPHGALDATAQRALRDELEREGLLALLG